jgi:hypothetical protein
LTAAAAPQVVAVKGDLINLTGIVEEVRPSNPCP